jgi:hypothetical protein
VSGFDLHNNSKHSESNPEDHDDDTDEYSHHPCYNYYRWLWIQFPWLRLGLYNEWAVQQHKRSLRKEADNSINNKPDGAKTTGHNKNRNMTLQEQLEEEELQQQLLQQQQMKQKSARKDPIVLRLERITEERCPRTGRC